MSGVEDEEAILMEWFLGSQIETGGIWLDLVIEVWKKSSLRAGVLRIWSSELYVGICKLSLWIVF